MSHLKTRKHQTNGERRPVGEAESLAKRVMEADEAYPIARKLLDGLNDPHSTAYPVARDRILDMLRGSATSARLSEGDIRGIRFFGGDKKKLEGDFGEKVYPATLTVPDDVWYNYYLTNDRTGEVYGRDLEGLLTELGYRSERELDAAIRRGLRYSRVEGEGERSLVSEYSVRRGMGLVKKLGEKDDVSGINIVVEDKPECYPFNKIGGISIIAESAATSHEDYHAAWRIYHGRSEGIIDELHARRVDVLLGRRTWDAIKKDLMDSDYVKEELRGGAGLLTRTAAVEHAIDAIAYLDRHLPATAVSHIILNAGSLRELIRMPEVLVMGEFKTHVLDAVTGRKQGDDIGFHISNKFVGGRRTATRKYEGPETERGVQEIEERVRDRITSADSRIKELRGSYGEKDLALLVMKCGDVDELLALRPKVG